MASFPDHQTTYGIIHSRRMRQGQHGQQSTDLHIVSLCLCNWCSLPRYLSLVYLKTSVCW